MVFYQMFKISSVVPRGSIVGPMFFIIFINDLPQQIMSKCFGYADNYTLATTNPVILQIDVHRISKWCQKMSLTLKKCKIVNCKGSAVVKMNRLAIQQAEVEKDLGNMISKTLT